MLIKATGEDEEWLIMYICYIHIIVKDSTQMRQSHSRCFSSRQAYLGMYVVMNRITYRNRSKERSKETQRSMRFSLKKKKKKKRKRKPWVDV